MYISGSKQLPVASLDSGACDVFMMNVLIEFDMCLLPRLFFSSLFYLYLKPTKSAFETCICPRFLLIILFPIVFCFTRGTLFNEGNGK